MSRPSHQWETGRSINSAVIEEERIPVQNLPMIVDPAETERIVEKLRKFDIKDIGNSAYFDQHIQLEKLNQQAHQNAASNSDEYVLEAFLTFGKLDVLIHDCILIEAWKDSVYPLLLKDLTGKNNMRLYFILYHEATLINLLEVFLYHKHVCEAGGEKMIEIVDYIARKLARLNNPASMFRQGDSSKDSVGIDASTSKEFVEKLESRTPEQELAHHFSEIEFRVCVSCVSICRFLCEHADAMPLSIASRIADTHDMLVLIVPLIENPPWTRRNQGTGKWQKLIDQKWTEVKPIDLLKITKLEGQPWITVYHLLAKQIFRERYYLNTFRKGQALRLRKYINELMLDQLPFLADIQRYMDELAITEVPEPKSFGGAGNVMMFQQVAMIRESIIKGKVWPEVARYQIENVFTMSDRNDRDLLKIAELYSNEAVETGAAGDDL
jgi:hypothetical protein